MQFSSRQLEEEEGEKRRRRHYLEKIEEEGGEYGPSHSRFWFSRIPSSSSSSGNEMVSFRGKDAEKKIKSLLSAKKIKGACYFLLFVSPL